MDSIRCADLVADRRLRDSALAPHVHCFIEHLTQHRYSRRTIRGYVRCFAHFARWAAQSRLAIKQVDERCVRRFLDDHLPRCNCPKPVSRSRSDLHAALKHLLRVLRTNAVIAERARSMSPVDEELRCFDDHMKQVRGLAPKTRRMRVHIVRRFLLAQFADRPVVMEAIAPEDVRRFVARQLKVYKSPGSGNVPATALRSYFRFRTGCGDRMHGLAGAVTSPANWQLASLPQTLSREEVTRLIASLRYEGPSARRTCAMVRCALDIGLRTSEIAKLELSDIDWSAGTVTLSRTKSRRQDVLPLPVATGRAIAAYLKFERPQTTNRAVFVRHDAPRDQPIGPDVVRKAIRRAYAHAGLPYTRSHLLRHTLASRLLDGGGSLKEVADVLRHRSLNTTLIYAKLDSRTLAAVALPWPGCTS